MSDSGLKLTFDAVTLDKIQARLGYQLDDPRAAEHLDETFNVIQRGIINHFADGEGKETILRHIRECIVGGVPISIYVIPRVSFGRFLLELLLSLKREKLVVTFQPPTPLA